MILPNVADDDTDAVWPSKYEGWHSRSQPHTSPSTFIPTRSNLVFAVEIHAMAENSFTVALFHPNIAIDAEGRVLVLTDQDFAGLTSMAEKGSELPNSNWRILCMRTCQPFHHLLYPILNEAKLKVISVYGYGKHSRQLERPAGDVSELPEILVEFFGLVDEAREGHEWGGGDQHVLSKVLEILHNDM